MIKDGFVQSGNDQDPTTAAWAEVFQRRIPGARGREHPTIAGGGHMLQESLTRLRSSTLLLFKALYGDGLPVVVHKASRIGSCLDQPALSRQLGEAKKAAMTSRRILQLEKSRRHGVASIATRTMSFLSSISLWFSAPHGFGLQRELPTTSGAPMLLSRCNAAGGVTRPSQPFCILLFISLLPRAQRDDSWPGRMSEPSTRQNNEKRKRL